MERWRAETLDNTPNELTKDWYDRETGKGLGKDKQIRGEMPGVISGGIKHLSN